MKNIIGRIPLIIMRIIILIVMFFISSNNVGNVWAANHEISSPQIVNGVVTWDCVYFGNYYQDNNTEKEPIKWRVLEVDGDKALLLSDKLLDVMYYNNSLKPITWESSTLRSWLNGYAASRNNDGISYRNDNFMDKAFDESEQSAINYTNVVAYDFGNDVNDKVFILSIEEITNIKYGFNSDISQMDPARVAKTTQYVSDGGTIKSTYISTAGTDEYWWLRTLGDDNSYAYSVNPTGDVDTCDWVYLEEGSHPIRPALCLSLSSPVWSYAGTVCSNGTGNELEYDENESSDINNKENEVTDAGTTNDLYYFTSTNSILGYNAYSELLSSLNFGDFKKTLSMDGVIIPGLIQTNQGNNTVCNTMVPQGICVVGKYILISACDESTSVTKGSEYRHTKHNSVIYVVDKNTKEYVTTIILKDNKSHVGALAWNGKTGSNGIIYIADSTEGEYKVWKMSYPVVEKAVSMGTDAVYTTLIKSSSVRLKPGFLTYYGGYVYVGEFVENKNAKMVTYNETLLSEFNPTAIELPVNTQGISFAQGKDGNTYMFASTSYGRKNKSTIYVCRANMNDKNRITSLWNNKKAIVFPNMSEDICIDSSGHLYTAYESAANIYRLNLDNSKNGTSQNPVDRITISSVSRTLKLAGFFTDFSQALKSRFTLLTYTESLEEDGVTYEDDVLLVGECGENLEFVLYNDGTLCISGDGAMYDYTGNEAPWNDYAEQINSLCIDADVTSIGNYAFCNLGNLLSVTFSEFLYDDVFSIGKYAFRNCSNLSEVKMPDIEFTIDDTAFPSDSNKLQIRSDSESVSEYCDANNVSMHTHTYEYKENISATCGSYGYDVYECKCGKEMHDNFAEPTDDHDFELISGTESTCVQYGVKEYQCQDCGAYYEEESTLAEHIWNSGIITKCSTTTATGTKTFTCSVCGKTKEEVIPKLSHESVTNDSISKPNGTTKIGNIKKTSIKKLTAKKKAIIISWRKKTGINGYQIQYSTTKKFKKSKRIMITKVAKTSKTINKLKSKKKYYVRIRTYIKVNGTKHYSAWSKVKSKKTK